MKSDAVVECAAELALATWKEKAGWESTEGRRRWVGRTWKGDASRGTWEELLRWWAEEEWADETRDRMGVVGRWVCGADGQARVTPAISLHSVLWGMGIRHGFPEVEIRTAGQWTEIDACNGARRQFD